jgi:hypothetical protein
MAAMARKLTLRDLAARLERLEDRLVSPILTLPHPSGVPGTPLLPEVDVDGTPLSWEQRTYWVTYPGKPKRPLRPGEYAMLKEVFGSKLIEPFPVRVGDAASRHPRHLDDDEDDDGDDE